MQKSDAGQHLISAVQALAEHKPFFTDRASQVLLDNFLTEAGKVKPTLTGREQIVVQLVAEGHTNKEMAAVLNISIKTVETHRSSAMRKLDLTSMAALVRYAVRNKLVRLETAPRSRRWRAEATTCGRMAASRSGRSLNLFHFRLRMRSSRPSRAQRDCEMKCGAAFGAVFSPDLPAIGLDDSTRDRQSEAGSTFLGRVEGLENLADLLVRDTSARIDHCHLDRGIPEFLLSE